MRPTEQARRGRRTGCFSSRWSAESGAPPSLLGGGEDNVNPLPQTAPGSSWNASTLWTSRSRPDNLSTNLADQQENPMKRRCLLSLCLLILPLGCSRQGHPPPEDDPPAEDTPKVLVN